VKYVPVPHTLEYAGFALEEAEAVANPGHVQDLAT
jgi:hypothetical protein